MKISGTIANRLGVAMEAVQHWRAAKKALDEAQTELKKRQNEEIQARAEMRKALLGQEEDDDELNRSER